MSDAVQITSEIKKLDVYAILCSLLYELHKVPEYSVISEMCYIIKDRESIDKFLSYFSGTTVTFPTKEEFDHAMQVLLLYHYSEVEKRPWKDALALAGYPSSKGKKAHNELNALKETLEKYNIGNRNY